MAFFVLGYAPGDPQAPSPAQPLPLQPAPDPGDVVVDHPSRRYGRSTLGPTGLWSWKNVGFKDLHYVLNRRNWLQSVVRLHRNLGHPRTEDFVRALVQHGRMDPECINLAKRLKCATCERTRRPLPPRPTSLKATGWLQRQGLHGLRLLARHQRHQAHVLAHLGPGWWLQPVCLVTIEIP